MKKSAIKYRRGILILLCLMLLLSSCSATVDKSAQSHTPPQNTEEPVDEAENSNITEDQPVNDSPPIPPASEEPTPGVAPSESIQPTEKPSADPVEAVFSLDDVPAYSGKAFAVINDHQPFFTSADISNTSFESYAPLDNLGRCGVAFACIGLDIMPTEERGSIGMVKPSGWHIVRYDGLVDGNYLYNRCHLIGYQLTGENANTSNLITGTRYLNIEGMLPYENLIAEYVEDSGNHVLYRVTPIFEGNNLLATGVLMEGMSVEDNGEDVCFCVFAYNVQPGVVIDYATGESQLADGYSANEPEQTPGQTIIPLPSDPVIPPDDDQSGNPDYILNTNTKKFHYPSCSSVDDMKEKNKQEFFGSRDDAVAKGYSPCGRCKP